MIGEIRDSETAQIAVQAAITGHLVVSTLHTNSAASTVTRIIDMGIEPYVAGDALVGVIAQRLVRRLCSSCKQARLAEPEEKKILGVKPEDMMMMSLSMSRLDARFAEILVMQDELVYMR